MRSGSTRPLRAGSESSVASSLESSRVCTARSTQEWLTRRGLPKHPGDLAKHDNVVFHPGGSSLALEGPKGVVKVAVAGRAAGNDFFFLREAIAAGVGIGPLPWFLASGELLAGRIVRVLPDYRAAGGTAYMVYPSANPLSPKLATFCAHLAEHVPRLAAQP